jgi:hypothetical protein
VPGGSPGTDGGGGGVGARCGAACGGNTGHIILDREIILKLSTFTESPEPKESY